MAFIVNGYSLIGLQLVKEVDEPLEGLVVSVYPEKVNFFQGLDDLFHAALRMLHVPVHDGLEDGGERSDSYASCYQGSMFSSKNVT